MCNPSLNKFVPRSPRKKRQRSLHYSRAWRSWRNRYHWSRCGETDGVIQGRKMQTGWLGDWQLKYCLEIFHPEKLGEIWFPLWRRFFKWVGNRQASLGFSNLSCFSLVVGWDQRPTSFPHLEAIKTALDEEDNGIPNLFFRSLLLALINTCFFGKFGSGFDQDPVFSAQELLSKPVLFGIWKSHLAVLKVLNLYLPCGRIWKNYKRSWMRCGTTLRKFRGTILRGVSQEFFIVFPDARKGFSKRWLD